MGDTTAAATPWPLPKGIRKFVLLSFFTAGLYDVYWFYWNWRRQRDRTNTPMRAGWRTFLSPFVAYILFRDVRRITHAQWNPGVLAAIYLIMVLSFAGPGWSWILAWLSFLPLVPVQRSINALHAHEPNGEAIDNRLTALDYGIIVTGAMLMALIIAAGMLIDSGALQIRLDQIITGS